MSLISTPFGATTTAADVVAGLTPGVRDVAAGHRVAADITATTGNAAVYVGELDLADITSADASSPVGSDRWRCWSTTPGR